MREGCRTICNAEKVVCLFSRLCCQCCVSKVIVFEIVYTRGCVYMGDILKEK